MEWVSGKNCAASWKAYGGLDNILFFSAWPMLGALIALWLLRDQDRPKVGVFELQRQLADAGKVQQRIEQVIHADGQTHERLEPLDAALVRHPPRRWAPWRSRPQPARSSSSSALERFPDDVSR